MPNSANTANSYEHWLLLQLFSLRVPSPQIVNSLCMFIRLVRLLLLFGWLDHCTWSFGRLGRQSAYNSSSSRTARKQQPISNQLIQFVLSFDGRTRSWSHLWRWIVRDFPFRVQCSLLWTLTLLSHSMLLFCAEVELITHCRLNRGGF